MKLPASALLLLVALELAGCGGFAAPPPARTPPPAMPRPPLSTVRAHLSVPLFDIAAVLNARTRDRLADIRDRKVKCGIGRCTLTLEAERTGPIAVSASSGALHLFLPFQTRAELAMPGFLSVLRAQADARGTADADLAPSLGPDWRVKLRSGGAVWLEKSSLRLGPLKTNLADVWNANEDMLSKPLFAMLGDAASDALRVRPQIEALWAKALKPIRIGKKPTMWLVLHPEALRVDGPRVAGNAVTLDFGVDVRAAVAVQETPPPPSSQPLPPPSPAESGPGRFVFAVPVLLPYDEAARIALEELKKHPPKVNGSPVRFDTLALLPSGEDVVISTSFCVDQGWDVGGLLSACGSGYLRGTPRFDAKTRILRIEGVHYDIQTENLILKAARVFAGPDLGNGIEGKLKFDLTKDIDKLQTLVAAAIAKEQGRDVAISGAVERFGDPTLTWTKDGFLATISAEGRVNVEAKLH